VDEVLAVGDAGFQEKCFEVFRRFKAEGRTIVFVSHDMASVQEFSDRVLLLDRGKARGIFSPAAAAVEYSRLNEEHANSLLRDETGTSRPGDAARPHIASIQMLDPEGNPTHAIQRGEAVTVRLRIANPKREPINAGVAIYRDDGLYMFGTDTVVAQASVPTDAEVTLNLDYSCMDIHQGTYWLTAGLFGARLGVLHEMRERLYSFHVGQSDGFEGVVYLRHQWRSG
jgi:teichoic acid transport system ATP-binding protein